MNKMLTVVIPSYNTFQFMDNSLNTMICVDNIEKIEILLVDDGSQDSTLEKARDWENKFPSIIKVIHKENGGHGSVINRGIKEAKGKYIKIIDGDDYVDSNQFSLFIEELEKIDSDVIFSPFTRVSAIDKSEIVIYPSTSSKFVTGCMYDADKAIGSMRGTIHSLTYRTSLLQEHFDQIKVSEKVFYEDNEYDMYPMLFAKTIFISGCNVYQYVVDQANQSVSMSNLLRRIDQQMLIFSKLITYYVDAERKDALNEQYKQYCSRIISNVAVTIYSVIFSKQDYSKQDKAYLISLDQELRKKVPLAFCYMNVFKRIRIIRAFRYSPIITKIIRSI
ncbi:glycosyltransferase family 2 protein [Oribacterium sp. P9]|uniref:glycosyltransferase family 2 protein n=1 Tax=Oribacterium sp. P9 TaxID=3378068 RepID=UPI0039674F08